MRSPLAVGFLAASLLQEAAPAPTPPPTEQTTHTPAESSPQNRELTIPAGTRIQVTLASPIRTKIARRGDAVHAMTAFPVASNGQVAIPAGTYLEGRLEKVLKRGPSGGPGLQMHFTRIVFANGYTVSVEKATAVAGNRPVDSAPGKVSTPAGGVASGEAFGPSPQQPPPPTLTPPPMPGPHIGKAVGIAVGVLAAGIIGGVLWSRHLRSDVVFDVGSPFEVVLDSPLSVELDRVSEAASASPR
jgi:hypothetical protein